MRRPGIWIWALFLMVVVVMLPLLDHLHPPPLGRDLPLSAQILARDGTPLRLFTTPGGYWRLPAELDAVDPRFLALLVGYEDKRFWSHPGVDPLALVRALWQALRHGRIVSGGSTLTLQTVRLLHPRPRTLGSKLVELVRALQLERRLDKRAILSLYLTLAPYGGNLQGIRAASRFYLGKEPSYLTLDEAALLVALPQSPEVRRPDRHPAQARRARDAVLARWERAGLVTADQARRAARRPLPAARRVAPLLAPHLTDRLRPKAAGGPLRTTLDPRLQAAVEALLQRHQADQAPGVTLAALVLEREGAVRAYAGSGDWFATRFPGQVDMVRAVRSPGSTLKPFIYGLGFEQGIIHPETLIGDRPGAVGGYAPGNFDHRFEGELRVREALRLSRNVPAIKVLERVGPRRLVDRLARAGVALRLPSGVDGPGLPVALGGVGVRLEELTGLYAALAAGGWMRSPRFLADAPSAPARRLLSAEAAWYLTDILGESTSPQGFLDRPGRLAFKTGTSYGFRDAWALGYDAGHAVGVWLGRPDGGFTPGLSGLDAAVPLLQELFGLLPSRGLGPLLRVRPEGVVTTAAAAAGESAWPRRFDPAAAAGNPASVAPAGPRILYPPDGSLVEWRKGERIRPEISGGRAPFHLLVDGRPVGGGVGRRELAWQPRRDGAVHLAVLDAGGRSDRVRLRLACTGGCRSGAASSSGLRK